MSQKEGEVGKAGDDPFSSLAKTPGEGVMIRSPPAAR